jgi:hypothetical protein
MKPVMLQPTNDGYNTAAEKLQALLI